MLAPIFFDLLLLQEVFSTLLLLLFNLIRPFGTSNSSSCTCRTRKVWRHRHHCCHRSPGHSRPSMRTSSSNASSTSCRYGAAHKTVSSSCTWHREANILPSSWPASSSRASSVTTVVGFCNTIIMTVSYSCIFHRRRTWSSSTTTCWTGWVSMPPFAAS